MEFCKPTNGKCHCEEVNHSTKFIVLTGGPGAGKTAVLELLKRTFCEHIAVLPESAGIVFGGGFWRHNTIAGKKGAQRAIFHVQSELEKIVLEEKRAAIALCDRGTIDGLAYWPTNEKEFWTELKTTVAAELKKYSLVIHLRTPELGNGYNRQNPLRVEDVLQAAALDKRIEEAWKGHPNRHFVESSKDFLEKAKQAIELIRAALPDCCKAHPVHLHG